MAKGGGGGGGVGGRSAKGGGGAAPGSPESVLAAATKIAGGNDRVLIGDIIKAVGPQHTDAVHKSLLQLQREDKVVLYRNDMTSQVLREKQHAMMVGDSPRHIVYLIKPRRKPGG